MDYTPLILLFTVFLGVMILGLPISFAMGVATVATLMLMFPFDQALFVMAQKTIAGFDSFTLLALPFFILAGNIMSTGGIARRLINLAKIIGRPLPGSLAHTTILANMMFGSISGSAVASAAAVGGVMTPEMKKAGYDPSYGAAVNIASCTTGLLIPPSGTFIIYSLISGGTSVSALFVAGYVPGLLLGLAMMLVAGVMAMQRGYRGGAFPSFARSRPYTDGGNPASWPCHCRDGRHRRWLCHSDRSLGTRGSVCAGAGPWHLPRDALVRHGTVSSSTPQ